MTGTPFFGSSEFLWAWRFSAGLCADAVYRYFFRAESGLGRLCLWSFFLDEIRFRRRTGLVLFRGPSVALLGWWPSDDMTDAAQSPFTRALIALQGPEYRQRWARASAFGAWRPKEPHLYLSAILTMKSERAKGHATRLLEEILEIATARNVSVAVEVSTRVLADWYAKRGFRRAGEFELPDGTEVRCLLTPAGA